MGLGFPEDIYQHSIQQFISHLPVEALNVPAIRTCYPVGSYLMNTAMTIPVGIKAKIVKAKPASG
jgi:hypothetical protein